MRGLLCIWPYQYGKPLVLRGGISCRVTALAGTVLRSPAGPMAWTRWRASHFCIVAWTGEGSVVDSVSAGYVSGARAPQRRRSPLLPQAIGRPNIAILTGVLANNL